MAQGTYPGINHPTSPLKNGIFDLHLTPYASNHIPRISANQAIPNHASISNYGFDLAF
jgi:hypothetical protein